MFDRKYMDYHNDRFTDHSLMFYDDDKLIALLPASVNEDIVVSHGGLTYGGLIVDNTIKQHTVDDCIELLITYLSDKGIKKLLYKPVPHIYHKQPCEEDLYALFLYGAHPIEVSASTVINLSEPLKMPKGRKAQIKRALREGVEVRQLCDFSSFKKFIDIENEVLKTRHNVQAVHSAEELYLLFERFPQNIRLFGSLYKDEIIAGTVIFEYESVVHTQYMAANDYAREIGALDLAIYTVIEEYSKSKLWLDFGISTENGGKNLNEGLISQKEGFGGRTNIYQLWEMDL